SDDAAFTTAFGEEIDKELRELWDFSREMTARVTWKPWMFNRQLPPLLPEVATPSLLVWGEHDRVIPLDCAKQYEAALPNATLEIVSGAGHLVEMEQPETLAALITGFVDNA
ncbi:MAG: alpha/beta hydrolase, partial [Chloroflexi bacterium]|nr:alpha/beta hydrolase [Chloroflexota bacterium]